jgi:Fe-S-cluster-containing dehydrogenase component/formate-dependent nitrite reductase membrane component NrfD
VDGACSAAICTVDEAMKYGFVIDQDRCIGCHACTVACKEEHNVPLGVFRTWVKYIEKGEFPDVSRHFGVMRCNHCDDAPCVEICPTRSLYHRADGIVDFDPRRCIGCKSCMQACPYDALYIDPNSNTAAKCNFCAHRVELHLEPSCVIVCPTQAIIAGDLDDSSSAPSRIIASGKVSSRKPHKGTHPKLFYVGIDQALLDPPSAHEDAMHLWGSRNPSGSRAPLPVARAADGATTSRVVYDVAHPAPWGWKIAAYLFTKSVGAGVLLVAALMLTLGYHSELWILSFAAPLIAMAFILATAVLLIVDLKRPDRFFFLLTKPNPRSWVVLGAWILIAYGALTFVWFATGRWSGLPPPPVVFATALFSIAAACYTGFLFAQARGRDLWQSSIFTWHLLVQAVIAGAAILLIAGAFTDAASATQLALGDTLAVSLIISLLMILGELSLAPPSQDVRLAIRLLVSGALRLRFLGGALGAGIVIPIVFLAVAGRMDSPAAWQSAAAILAMAGIWIFDSLWVTAGQAVPLS